VTTEAPTAISKRIAQQLVLTLTLATSLLCVVAYIDQAHAKHLNHEAGPGFGWLKAPSNRHMIASFLSGSGCELAVQNSIGVKRVTFYLDHARLSTTTAPPYSCHVNAAKLSVGTHILKARVLNTNGRVVSVYSFISIPWRHDPGTTVTVQGDSLTKGSWWRMPEYLGSRFEIVSVSTHDGRPSVKGVRLLRHQRLGRVVVFALGTNDWWSAPRTYRRHLHDVMRIVGPDRCVVLPTIWHAGHPLGWANEILQSMAMRYGPKRIQLAQWAGAVAAGQVRLHDGTHPANHHGWAERAEVVAEAINACAANSRAHAHTL
jgi:hypothetical protein